MRPFELIFKTDRPNPAHIDNIYLILNMRGSIYKILIKKLDIFFKKLTFFKVNYELFFEFHYNYHELI